MSDRLPALRSGLCPQCGSERVRSGRRIPGKEGDYGANRIPVTATIAVPLDNYICLDCGYVESYILDRTALNLIEQVWPRVRPKRPDEENASTGADR